jgi:hypothetical protein
LSRIELWIGVTWNTGTCARDRGHNIALTTTRQMTGSRITRVWMREAFLSTGPWKKCGDRIPIPRDTSNAFTLQSGTESRRSRERSSDSGGRQSARD